jgi:hypothetical protein
MKAFLRCLGLGVVLVATSVSPVLSSTGTCRIGCWGGPGSGSFTTVSLQTTYNECCSRTINPCPTGMNPLGYSYGYPPEKCDTIE